jgi:hypothetical protein
MLGSVSTLATILLCLQSNVISYGRSIVFRSVPAQGIILRT